MTLIVSVSEGSLACVSDDGDSGCLARSPDDIAQDEFSDDSVTPNLKRQCSGGSNEPTGKKSIKRVEDDDLTYNVVDEDIHDIKHQRNQNTKDPVQKAEIKISLNSALSPPASEALVFYQCRIETEFKPKHHQLQNHCDSNEKPVKNNSHCYNYTKNGNDIEKGSSPRSTNKFADQFLYENASNSCDLRSVDMVLNSQKTYNFENNMSSIGYRNSVNIPIEAHNLNSNFHRKSSYDHTRNYEGSKHDNISNQNILLDSPENDKKVRLRKLMQRRSVSETSSNEMDLTQLKKAHDRKRHSFSAYSNYDKITKVLDRNLGNGIVRSGINDFNISSKAENFNISLFNDLSRKGSRRNSVEITDDLIKNIKISMIEEYKNLKKNNSSLFNQDSTVQSENDISHLHKCAHRKFHNGASSCVLKCDAISQTSEINVSPTNNLRSSCVTNTNLIVPEIISMNNTDVALSKDSKIINTSSPPTRLETWKSILAEKRNSVKSSNRDLNCLSENVKEFKEPLRISNSHVCNLTENSLNKSNLQRNNHAYITEKPATHCTFKSLPVNDFTDMIELQYKGKLKTPQNKFDISSRSKVLNNIPEETISKDLYTANSSRLSNEERNIDLTSEHCSNLNGNTKFINKVKMRENSLDKSSNAKKCNYVLHKNNDKRLLGVSPSAILNGSDGLRQIDHNACYISSEDDSDYCQTDECGDDCDYSSGEEADKEDDDICEHCADDYRTSSACPHDYLMVNSKLKPLSKQMIYKKYGNKKAPSSRSLVLQAAIRRRHLNQQELAAIQEYSITSDDQQGSDEEQSHDESMCDLSSSWRYGLCDISFPSSDESVLSGDLAKDVRTPFSQIQMAKLKSNSLPTDSPKLDGDKTIRNRPGSAIVKGNSHLQHIKIGDAVSEKQHFSSTSSNITNSSFQKSGIKSTNRIKLHPAMGLQGLQQRPSINKSTSPGVSPYPITVPSKSPVNSSPPFSVTTNSHSSAHTSPESSLEGRRVAVPNAPSSPRTNCRSGALITRNFSISDDESGERLSRRQVTISRHENAYKEAADKGYQLTPSSHIDPYWLTWKLGVLQKTIEEVSSRLGESEDVVSAWGPVSQDQNIAEQQVQNIRKFRENLPDLQRGIDDVNDQAARFSAHNVPLTPNNSAALHDLNNRWKNLETTVNDRWRQLAGRSSEITPLTLAQLATSVSPPWERAAAANKVPYYINHAQETTHWDHPQMMDLLDSLSEYNHIKFSAYRTASKLRSLQKKLSLDRAKLHLVTDVFDEHGLRGQNDRLIDINDMVVVLSTLYGRIANDNPDVDTTLSTDLCLNWLLNVYDSQRTGQMRVLSFRIGLICMCRGQLEEKYRYLFRLIADPNRLVDQRKLGLLLHDCVQVPRQLGEVAAFGGSNIEPSVRSCFTKAGKDRETIEAVHFLTWVQQEPQSLVWLAVLHRVAASETVQHQVKCNICKTYPIVGLRYRCLKCLSFDMCQRCFFEGRSTKSHKITHPMHEYCTATKAGDEMKDFTKALKNKFKSKRSLQKHTKKGYLPVQTVLEGDALESPCPSPAHNVGTTDMHSRLEVYASRLAEVELRTNSNSTPDSEDEHGLIAQYCQSLTSSDTPFPVPKSPLQIMASTDADQKDELEQMIKDLEEENRALQTEYERLKSEQPSTAALDEAMGQRSEAEMLAEAKLLREHKGRLEARMGILEDHNRQLEAQLQRLRQLLMEQTGVNSPNKSSTLQTKSVTASQLATDSPAKINGHNGHANPGDLSTSYDGLDQMSEYVRPPPPPVGTIAHMGNLFSRAGDLGKVVGSLVDSMNQETENGSHSDENDYDNVTNEGASSPPSQNSRT